jgi:aminopeptidase 2
MENWGLITGRTSAFLLDPKSADLQAKKQVATTQSHEVAHMWCVRFVSYALQTDFYLPGLGSAISQRWNGGTIYI